MTLTVVRPPADPALVSGGDVYDARVIEGLRADGVAVRDTQIAGTWPRPDGAARRELDAVLADGDGPVLLDGLVACGVPEIVVPHATQFRDAADVDDGGRVRHPQPQHRDEGLPAGEDLAVLTGRADRRNRFGDRRRPHVVEARGDHCAPPSPEEVVILAPP